jgi:hypothetical protein
MKSVKTLIADQDVSAEPIHLAAAEALIEALMEGTAEAFARLPLEAEPSAFQAELRR